jgi:hypothetical protein
MKNMPTNGRQGVHNDILNMYAREPVREFSTRLKQDFQGERSKFHKNDAELTDVWEFLTIQQQSAGGKIYLPSGYGLGTSDDGSKLHITKL